MPFGAQDPNKKYGKCEVCDTESELSLHYGNMWFCPKCWQRELQATAENFTPAKQEERVNAVNDAVKEAQKIDTTINVRTDLFNAATTSILELKAAIDVDEAVVNKPYELAKVLMERFEHFKQVVFEMNEKIAEAGNQQKAIQIYLNTLANQLRAEERLKLGVADISYRPTPIKPKVRKVTTSQTKKSTKLDKAELRKVAAELGLPEYSLQMVVVQKGISIQEAADILKKSIEAAKQG